MVFAGKQARQSYDFAARLSIVDQREAAHQFDTLVEAKVSRVLMLECLRRLIETVAAANQPTANRR